MSLHQLTETRAELVASSCDCPSGLELQRAAASRRFAVCACALLLAGTGCSFDAQPAAQTKEDATSRSTWMPRTAADRGSRTRSGQSAVESDAAVETSDAEAARADGGAAPTSTRPSQGRAGSGGASGSNSTPRDAGVPLAQDAGAMAEPAQPDAATAPQVDAAVAMPPPDAATTMPTPDVPDAATMPTMPTTPPASLCEGGMYSGGFSGSVRARGSVVSNPFGAVSARLALDATGQYLELQEARVVGIDRDRNTLSVTLTGRINCASGQLEEGRLEEGSFFFSQRRSTFSFSGTTEATYTPDPPSIVGTWEGQADDASWVQGTGAWTLSLNMNQ